MRDKWFDYVIANKKIWANGFTLKRLNNVRDAVLSDTNIMYDLLKRHSAEDMTPEQMQSHDMHLYNHCIGNFTCNILYKMIEQKLIKR